MSYATQGKWNRALITDREALGPLKDIAEQLGIHWRTLYRYERGESPTPKWLRLALLGLGLERMPPRKRR
jgi:hypothetical protein